MSKFPVGVQLAVLAGEQEVPTPIGPTLADLLIEAEVTEVADGQSTFRLTFGGQRSDKGQGPEVAVIEDGRLSPGNRVLVIATQAVVPTTLIDGLITDWWLDPGKTPGDARLVVSGADLSVAMDVTERITGYPDMDEAMIVEEIIATYARFEIVPETIPPVESELPTVVQRTPIQYGTDLDYLYRLADRFGYVFTVRPGPVPMSNTAYWGPPKRIGLPQPALTVGGGGFANVESLTFTLDGRAAFTVEGLIPGSMMEDPALPVIAMEPTLLPLTLDRPYPIGSLLGSKLPTGSDGYSEIRAEGLAQGRVNKASTRIAKAEGALSVVRYGAILHSGALVGVRGAGVSFDGLWSVEKVTHKLRRNSFRQEFALARDGTVATTPVVTP